MASKDKFSANLRCPTCGKEGIARLWEYDGAKYAFGDKSTYIESLTDGFTSVEAPSWIRNDLDIRCAEHPDVSAIVKAR